ncbi:putative cyclin protein [Neofusicoccum parvum UCRNP2]|uniref:RNA polymerase II holoenzyme cyclin-like subunit n=1 Tax=Botryosphaeria parva (strain UCR-NP2) TaxID=1287680 RepID=R1GRN5_BOTPV|nr:putative cyclin protein [Neofusicoccum parvum UCRNP2]
MPSHLAAPSRPRERPRPPNPVAAQNEQQWIFTEEDLLHTPSIEDGMPPEQEKEMRYKGMTFIYQVGAMLKLPQLTLSTAGVFLNRFITRRSLVSKDGYKALHHYQIAATSLFLATKVEENCRKMKELVIACCRVAQKNPNLLVDEQTKDFWRWRDTILYNEDVLLETICFDLTIDSPHKLLFDMLVYHGVEHHKRLRNAAWSFINDSNLTQLCLLFTSRTIAAAALYCGARLCDVGFEDEDGKPWWEIQHVTLRDIRRTCNYMANIYENVPPQKGGESIYVGLRTPEDGDPLFAQTRLRTSQTPTSPAPSSVGMERTSSEQGVKRSRDEVIKTENGDGDANGSRKNEPDTAEAVKHEEKKERVSEGEPGAKRIKTEANGASAEAQASTEEGKRIAADEDLSEEGEVEE